MYIKIKSKESIRNTPDAFYNEDGDRTEYHLDEMVAHILELD